MSACVVSRASCGARSPIDLRSVHLMNHRGGPSVTERQTLRQELQPVQYVQYWYVSYMMAHD